MCSFAATWLPALCKCGSTTTSDLSSSYVWTSSPALRIWTATACPLRYCIISKFTSYLRDYIGSSHWITAASDTNNY